MNFDQKYCIGFPGSALPLTAVKIYDYYYSFVLCKREVHAFAAYSKGFLTRSCV